MKKLIIITFLLILLTACSSNETTNNQLANMSINKPTVLFFWLPTGAPCQEQNKILSSIMPNYPDVSLEYVDATNQGHRDKFYEYGVRSLPSLVILNNEGEIQKQFTPGIHSSEEIEEQLVKL